MAKTKQQRIDQIWRNSTTKIVYHLNIHIHKKYFVIAIYQEWLLIIHNSTFTNTASTLTRIWRIIHAKNIYFLTWKCCLNERWRSLLLTYFNPTHLLVRQPSPKLDVQKFERLSYLFYSIPIFHILQQKLFQNVTVCCIKEMS